jgi:hypothetical protein
MQPHTTIAVLVMSIGTPTASNGNEYSTVCELKQLGWVFVNCSLEEDTMLN